MNIKRLRTRLEAMLAAALAWLTETTRESRSARLSTLGLPTGEHDWHHGDRPSQGGGCR
jgi:hypothetical protein